MNIILFACLFLAICLIIGIIFLIPNVKRNYDKENNGANILSFFFPIVGFIIYAVNVGKKNNIAKSCIRMSFLGMMCATTIFLISKSIIIIATPVEKDTYINNNITNISISNDTRENIKNIINDDGRTSEAKVVVQGKIIDIIFNVDDGVSVEDAHIIAQKALSKIPEKIKSSYDVQFMITCKTETSDGQTKKFPIMGYKRVESNTIIW